MTPVILPGSTIGVLGSGQLGRMFTMAARRMGYRVHTLSPDEDTPTGQIADVEIAAPYDDLEAIRAFARGVDVVTFEFENVSVDAATAASDIVPVRPSGRALHIAQQRVREKTFLSAHGFPVVPFATVRTREELAAALATIGVPAIVKTAAFGYDGKGQQRVSSAQEAEYAWDRFGEQEIVIEKLVDLERELSVVAARGVDGDMAHFGVLENSHNQHILDITVSPARVDAELRSEAIHLTRAILTELEYVGVLCVEFFLTTSGRLVVNELAPRPHNSGHYSVDACMTSQFEQQVRTVCGLPLGSTEQMRPAAMANLLGDLWADGEPDWIAGLASSDVKLHLYGKNQPRPGRKMGHVTALADSADVARARVVAARAAMTVGRDRPPVDFVRGRSAAANRRP